MSNPNKNREKKIQNTINMIFNDSSMNHYLRTIFVWIICENEKRRKENTDNYLKISNIEKILKERGFYEGI